MAWQYKGFSLCSAKCIHYWSQCDYPLLVVQTSDEVSVPAKLMVTVDCKYKDISVR